MPEDNHHVCPVERAGGLDSNFRKLFQNPKKILKPYISADINVMDLGCGPGFFTTEIAKMLSEKGKVYAVDLQQGMLDIVKSKIENTEIENRVILHKCESDMINLAESKSKIDFALAFYMVHEVPSSENFLAEVYSLLRTNGKLLIIEPNFHVKKAAFAEMIKTTEKVGFEAIEYPRVTLSKSVVLEKK